MRDLAPRCLAALEHADALLTPTAGRLFTIEEMLAEPVVHNSALGYYTSFVNLLDLAAVAVPTGFTEAGLPFGVTVVADHFADRALLSIARRLEDTLAPALGERRRAAAAVASPISPSTDARRVELLVCGAHLSGMSLEHQLLDRGARLLDPIRTDPAYRLYALSGDGPPRPGLRHVADGGVPIEAELWSVPSAELGDLVVDVPAPLGIGRVALEDGRKVTGFVCEERGFAGAEDISAHGGWRAWRASLARACARR